MDTSSVVIKRPGPDRSPALVAAERGVLDVARHPGVVELVTGPDGQPPEVATARVAGSTLANDASLTLEEIAGLLATLATTLADLHELGIVHGAVAPEHVLVDPGGRPVLCGFGHAGRSLAPSPSPRDPHVPPEFVDPAYRVGDPLRPHLDVYALGALITYLTGRAPTASVPGAPSRPPSRARGGLRRPDSPGLLLLQLAQGATAPDPDTRPSARRFAAAVHDTVPRARLPHQPIRAAFESAPAVGPARPRRPPISVRRAAAVMVMVLVLVGLVRVLDGMRSARASAGVPAAARAGSTPPPPPGVACGAAPRNAPPAPAPECDHAVTFTDGVLAAGRARWRLGQPGDQVVTGHWACDGRLNVALLRPATGLLFRLDGWAAPGHALTVAPIALVHGAVGIRAAAVRPGCDDLVVDRRGKVPLVFPHSRP